MDKPNDMKLIPIILLSLTLSGHVSGQWQKEPCENYICAGMLVTTFLVVDYHSYCNPCQTPTFYRQQASIVVTCMATTVITYHVVKHIRKKKQLRKFGYYN